MKLFCYISRRWEVVCRNKMSFWTCLAVIRMSSTGLIHSGALAGKLIIQRVIGQSFILSTKQIKLWWSAGTALAAFSFIIMRGERWREVLMGSWACSVPGEKLSFPPFCTFSRSGLNGAMSALCSCFPHVRRHSADGSDNRIEGRKGFLIRHETLHVHTRTQRCLVL